MTRFTTVFFDGRLPPALVPSAAFASLRKTRDTAFDMADDRRVSSIKIEGENAELIEHWFRDGGRWRLLTRPSQQSPN
jgi:hypothetical protein